MVGVEHRLDNQVIKKEVQEDIRFLLTNRDGSYLMFSSGNPSRYDGFFMFDKKEMEMYKIIDSFGIGFNNIINNFNSVEFNNIRIALPEKKNCLIINPNVPIALNLDIRKSYDLRQWGRFYNIIENKNEVVIGFTKKTDSREDPSQDQDEFSFFVVVMHDGTHKILNNWIRVEYPFDRERNSPPFERYVFQALGIDAKKIVIAASKDTVQAEMDAKELFKKYKEQKFKPKDISKDKEINLAYNSALIALDNLIVNGRMFAGLPWFFQFWTRDEAIAVGALLKQKRYNDTKDILFKELSFVQPNGRLANRMPGSKTDSADTTGWCLYRLSQFSKIKKLDKTELIFLKAKLEYILDKYLRNYIKDNLVYNNQKETWMDTMVDGQDGRNGARIEVQALQLALYKFVYQLSMQEEFVDLAKNIKERVKSSFWDGSMLADGLHDFTIRPNIFIAYYVYPELLTKNEWIKCFENALQKLWLEWGGLATIDRENSLFKPKHTGEDNVSYHRGDSWYWINNLAAICMHRLDKERFKKYIDKILEASTREILWMGAIANHAELSSAFRQESRGCLSQAWSLAMYIELVDEMFG